jgi:hypothetical protein
MATATIDPELIRSLEYASAQLTARIRDAIDGFYASLPPEWVTWETRRTPKPWETRVLPNLERYHQDLKTALQAYDAGDIKPITLAAAAYAGLSKDLEFDMSWMIEQDRIAVQKVVDQVVTIADQIHRLGYEALTTDGRA